MGQSKLRGSFEQRQALAIEKAAKVAYARKQLELAKEAAMTPEQKAERAKVRTLLTMTTGLAAGGL